jgi:hypothetical protein
MCHDKLFVEIYTNGPLRPKPIYIRSVPFPLVSIQKTKKTPGISQPTEPRAYAKLMKVRLISPHPPLTNIHLLNLLLRRSIRVILSLLNLHRIAILRATLSALAIILVHLVDAILVGMVAIESVQRLEDSILSLEDPAVDPIWESLGELVAHVGACGDGEDVVEFFEGTLFSFRDPEENHDQCQNIGSGVEAEDSL